MSSSEPGNGSPRRAALEPLAVLQTIGSSDRTLEDEVRLREAATAVAYGPDDLPSETELQEHARLSRALRSFLIEIVSSTPPGPERSTAISRAREAYFWATAAVTQERNNTQPEVNRGDS